ncbi:uncharacterized protein K452DRAFT_282959 [Aplosporella prunicola CBS 121167]|uniref:Chromatin modification-related protein EAF6 n=1 Tax=Aplosporella prunicola CBS 121167 TaxID=1176127 RepID=A0A6A6BU73_9PEZI|nr:uncharacterized protein K452DRAFT_282959 [Aplosporella prunicola CBS 121167]KAF2146764.1 hypothetical protein K452DRAFT_282959 [Aplosporella prunicola CBS 121167]
MADNAPQPDAPAGPANDSTTRGMPYYEKLRRDLREALQKKRAIDNALNNIEDLVFKTEERYLEETSGAGNIVKGFENYIKGSSIAGAGVGGAGTGARRKTAISDVDRIFSRSSQGLFSDSPGPGSAQLTPSNAPTPTSFPSARESNHPTPGSTASKATSSKKRAANKDEEDTDGKPATKRGKITYGRD